MEALAALGINLGYLLVQIISFVIAVSVLSRWVYNPILDTLEKRRMAIAKGIEDARIAGEARANAEKKANEILAEAQSKASSIVSQATQRAEAAARDVRMAAESEAAKLLESAQVEGQKEKERMLADLRPQVVALSLSATQKLLGEALDEKRQHALLADFFSGVKAGKIAVLESGVRGASAEVTSALPLTDEEKESVQKDLLARAGAESVAFYVDPNILGGIIVKVGDRVMDGSVAGKLTDLREKIS